MMLAFNCVNYIYILLTIIKKHASFTILLLSYIPLFGYEKSLGIRLIL